MIRICTKVGGPLAQIHLEQPREIISGNFSYRVGVSAVDVSQTFRNFYNKRGFIPFSAVRNGSKKGTISFD